MSTQSITYPDKDNNSSDPDERLFRDVEANEIKTVVNANKAQLDAAISGVLSIAGSVASQGSTIISLTPSSVTTSSNIAPIAGSPYAVHYVVGAAVEFTLNASPDVPLGWFCRVTALGGAVTLVPGAANTQVLVGPSVIPQGAIAEIQRVSVGDANLNRYAVMLLHTP